MRRNYYNLGLLICLLLILSLLLILIPALLVDFEPANLTVHAGAVSDDYQEPNIIVDVLQRKMGNVVAVPLEDYVRGVVASEMPVNFELESLRAQALAARTFIMNKVHGNKAKVTDTVKDQVYATDAMLKKRWGSNYTENMQKIKTAVDSTKGEIITYHEKPIYAAFFSTSNGHTENSEDYFQAPYPYLRSVASPWDKQSPKFYNTKTIPLTTVSKDLEVHTKKRVAMTAFADANGLKILKKTPGDRVAKLKIGDQVFTGREVREALGLASSDFTWSLHGNKITFTTFGYGHGVGMSQWGANLLAEQGKTAEQIIHYYYTGVTIQRIK